MATLKYRVHGVATVSRPVKVMFQGDEVDATVEGVEVDLVPVNDPTHGSLTWRFVGKDAVDARAEFHNGGLGTITWEPAAAVPVEPSTAEKLEAGSVSVIKVDTHGRPI